MINNSVQNISLGLLFFLVSGFCFQSDNIQINVRGVAYFVIEDPQGQKSGYDPYTETKFDEIPGGDYANFTLGSLESDAKSRTSHEFGTNAENPPVDGTYQVTVHGVELGKFEITVFLTRDGKFNRFQKIGITDSGSSSNFLFTKGDNSALIKKADHNSLRKNVELSYKIGWILNKGIYISLLQKLNSASRSYDRGQINAATNTLQAFINELEAEEEKNLAIDAVTILKEDAELLIQKWGTEL